MYIDTHCHISDEYYEDIDKVINESLEKGVKYLIISGCDKEGINEAIKTIERYENVYATIGYHPHEVESVTDDDLENLKKLIKSNKKIIGVGETGLDYYYTSDNKEEQKELFIKQIRIAKELNLPIVVHSRDSFQDTYDILKKEEHYGVIHCFTGSIETGKLYNSIGYYLGIGGVITFKNTNLRDTIKELDINRLLIETDAPYLAPVPHRGKENSPKYIPLIGKEIAKALGKTEKEIREIIYNNTNKIFKIDSN